MRGRALISERAVAAFCRAAPTPSATSRPRGLPRNFTTRQQAAKMVDEGRSTGSGGGGGSVAAGTGDKLQGMAISIKDAMNMKGAVSKR